MAQAETIIEAESSQKSYSTKMATEYLSKFSRNFNTGVTASITAADAAQTVHLDSRKNMAVIVGLYAILVSGGLWASINLLRWFWHQLL